MEQEFTDRINLNTDLSNVSRKICNIYNLGEYILNEKMILNFKFKIINYLIDYFYKNNIITLVLVLP